MSADDVVAIGGRSLVVRLDAGRTNWTAPFTVAKVQIQASKLLAHHSARLIDERDLVEDRRIDLTTIVSSQDYTPSDPNKTQVRDWDSPKNRAEASLGVAQAAVTDRLKLMGELRRYILMFNQMSLDATIYLTIDDIQFFRFGNIDVEVETEDRDW